MKLSIGIFFGGFFGALGILFFLVAFGTDYWLLVREGGNCSEALNQTREEKIIYHHEGFFWRCWYDGNVDENTDSIWKYWYTNQAPTKNCTHAYLSPFPFFRDEHNSTTYNSAIIYRGFWSVLMLLGVVTVVTASFFIICAAPFGSHVLYKAGGGFFITAGLSLGLLSFGSGPVGFMSVSWMLCALNNHPWLTSERHWYMEEINTKGQEIALEFAGISKGILFTLVVVMYVIWVQAMADLENYKITKRMDCPDFYVSVQYGWSFILAPVGIFFAMFSGMLFLLIGRTIYLHSA